MFYFVEPWDSIEIIAQKFGISMNQLFLYNPFLYVHPVYIGQKLYIPLPDSKTGMPGIISASDTSNDSNNNEKCLVRYTVKIGDSLESIAMDFNTTVDDIMKQNGLGNEIIKAGDILLIRTSRKRGEKEPDEPFESIREVKDITTRSKYKYEYLHDLYLNKDIDIWKEIGYENAFFFVSKMAITAAGAPKAFHKENDKALDYLANAGTPGNWWGLVTESHGYPVIQEDPCPGYYISKTALSDCNKEIDDQARYVDATKIPYIVLPTHHTMGAELGDLSVVINTENDKYAYAVFADVGPDDSIGIGSIALAKELGIESDAKHGGIQDKILYIVFPQSGKEGSKICYECSEDMDKLWCKRKTHEQIVKEADLIFKKWGGMDRVQALFGDFPLTHNHIRY